jgi:hypothetical protein
MSKHVQLSKLSMCISFEEGSFHGNSTTVETKGLKFAKSIIFPDSRHDSKKKKFYSKALNFHFFHFHFLVFGCFLARKRGLFTKVTVQLPKTREINHSKTFFHVKISVLSVFEQKNLLRVCLNRLF